MTVQEARDFFKLWPRWRQGGLSFDVTRVEPHKNGLSMLVFDERGDVAYDGVIEDFIRTRDRVPAALRDPAPDSSWWWDRRILEPFRILQLIQSSQRSVPDPMIVLFQRDNGEFVGQASVCTEFHRLTVPMHYDRITPGNFPWSRLMLPEMKMAMQIAVFGSIELANEAANWAQAEGRMNRKPALGLIQARKTTLDPVGDAAVVKEWEKILGIAETAPSKREQPIMDIDYHKLENDMLGRIMKTHPISQAATRALDFISGLNLQDHSVKEQRQSLEVVRALMEALHPGRGGK